MWYQFGSKEELKFRKAKKLVKKLNNNKYAGYKDWRLPTLEEAILLLELHKRDDLIMGSINNVFDPICNNDEGQSGIIWTGDKAPLGRWCVQLSTGFVSSETTSRKRSVLPVCSIK
jgi:hypothetical protein